MEATVRIVNIGPRERRKRLTVGVAVFGAGVVVAVLLVAFGVAPVWRIPLFAPFWGAALGYFQARDKT